MSTESKRLIMPDNRILAYKEYGNPSGKPVFFFHGIPGSRIFRPPDEVTSLLGVRLICTDRPGFGLSTYQKGRHITDWPQDVCILADFLGVEKFYVAGHSGGGPYSLACAYSLPDRVLGTAVISGIGPIHELKSIPGNTTTLKRFAFSYGRYIPWTLWRLLIWFLYRRGHKEPEYLFNRESENRALSDVLILKDNVVLQMNYDSQSEGFRQGTRGFALEARLITSPWNIPLQDIHVPVHIWHGTEDVDTPVEMGHVMAERIPSSRLTILEGEAHMLVIPHWEEILEDLISNK